MSKIGKATIDLDAEGNYIRIFQNRKYKINGERFKAVGEDADNVYFKHLATGKFISIPKVDVRKLIKAKSVKKKAVSWQAASQKAE